MSCERRTSAVGQGSGAEPGDGVLLTRGHGYVLRVAPGELDLERFAEAAERGRDALATGRPEEAARLLREALALWRGPPLAEFTYRAVRAERDRAARGASSRRRGGARRGRSGPWPRSRRSSVSCAIWSARHPLRERLRGQLMLALYRCGGRPRRWRSTRSSAERCLQELGLEPGPGLQQLELAILNSRPGARRLRRDPRA